MAFVLFPATGQNPAYHCSEDRGKPCIKSCVGCTLNCNPGNYNCTLLCSGDQCTQNCNSQHYRMSCSGKACVQHCNRCEKCDLECSGRHCSQTCNSGVCNLKCNLKCNVDKEFVQICNANAVDCYKAHGSPQTCSSSSPTVADESSTVQVALTKTHSIVHPTEFQVPSIETTLTQSYSKWLWRSSGFRIATVSQPNLQSKTSRAVQDP